MTPLTPFRSEPTADSTGPLEIASVLFVEIVDYYTLSMNSQMRVLGTLRRAIRSIAACAQLQAENKLIHLPVGAGSALVFFDSPESPVEYAFELARTLQCEINLRMGIHTGPVRRVVSNRNVFGEGIDVARQVMERGDVAHIVVSQIVAETVQATWKDIVLQRLGDIVVKSGDPVQVYAWHLDTWVMGNSGLPRRIRKVHESRQQISEQVPAKNEELLRAILQQATESQSNTWSSAKPRSQQGYQELGPLNRADGSQRRPLPAAPRTIGSSGTEGWGHAPRPTTVNEVSLGASVPRVVAAGEKFVARFAAYTQEWRAEIDRIFEQEAPSSQRRLDLDRCRWRRNAKVTVHLHVDGATVSNSVQTFGWNASWKVLRFDIAVFENISIRTLILKFDVAVEGLPLLTLRPEIEVLREDRPRKTISEPSFVGSPAPKSAFACYAKADRREVLGRVRSLQIFTGIDVFMDCLSLRPGEEWKSKLRDEIANRDVFWLFWSRNAIKSEWVDWEWRKAVDLKSIKGIQPHPLEPEELAPAPRELSDLQFGAIYDWYVSHLRESWFNKQFRILRRRAVWALSLLGVKE